MSKLKLNLDELKVESFETNSSKSGNGTVVGQAPNTLWCNVSQYEGYSCQQQSCMQTCAAWLCDTGDGTCAENSCDDSCIQRCVLETLNVTCDCA